MASRRAAELVLPRSASREQWLAARRTLIGSSDIANILGAGRHGPYTVWADKTGRLDDSDGMTVDMARGIDLEDAAVRHWRRYHPELITRKAGLMRSTRYERAGASVDRRSRCPDGRCITEVKTQGSTAEWGTPDDPEVPTGFQFQGYWQMYVLGVDHIHFLVMGPRFHMFQRVMVADGELQAWMVERARLFWDSYVATDEPPEATAGDTDALKAMWPEPLRGHPHHLDGIELDWMHEIVRHKRVIEEHGRLLADAEAALQSTVGEATEVLWPDGVTAATWRPTKTIDGADAKWRTANAELTEPHVTAYRLDRAVMDRLRAMPLPVDVALALDLADPAAIDLAALVNGGPLPEGLRYRRQWLVKKPRPDVEETPPL